MSSTFSRRGLLAATGAGAAGLTLSLTGNAQPVAIANPAGLKLLSSTDGVNIPPKSTGLQKFSYSWPEPSISLGAFLFAFEIETFENAYAIDPACARTVEGSNGLTLIADGFTWAGGQEKAPGSLRAIIKKQADGALEWSVSVKFMKPVKGVKTIVRGVPFGKLSMSGNDWSEPHADEKMFEYPALMGGMTTPLVCVQEPTGKVWAISALQTEVRPARFYFWPGPDNYKLELIYEQAGWDRRGDVTTHTWRIGSGASYVEATRPHFSHVRSAFNLPLFSDRSDAPAWMKDTGLVLSLHGQHWTGYIMNDYARQLEILRWAARKTDPRHTMVFLAGWDGRYYWDYPTFDVDPRMGGVPGFRNLIGEGHKLGYKFLLMFGSNIANPSWPEFHTIADAQVRDVYGMQFPGNYVDWDGDRKPDSTMTFMNLAVTSWRNHLAGRISYMIQNYGVDSYFLDICGCWENNPDGDMFEGTRKLVDMLAKAHPGVPAAAEMQYDAQMGIIPMSHVPRYPLNPADNFDYVASFDHLSHPAPGRGSTGCHEWGFGKYKPVAADQDEIPTITFGDDTFCRYRDLVEADIETANKRFAAIGGHTNKTF